MTYIELVRAVRGRSGVQGTGPASISSASGAELDLVNATSDAWMDLQNYRDDWRWLRDEKSFLISPSSQTYTPAQIFVTPPIRHKRWLKEKMAYCGTEGSLGYIPYIPYDYFQHLELNNIVGKKPAYYTVRESDNALVFPKLDQQYTFKINYQKSPQVLSAGTDVPELPEYFHLLIVYAAIEKYSVVISSPEVYQKYSYDHAKLMGALMRDQLPKKILRVGGIA